MNEFQPADPAGPVNGDPARTRVPDRPAPSRYRIVFAAALSVLALAGCAGGPEIRVGDGVTLAPPEDQGLYAYRDGELIRLDGDTEWERKTWEERSSLGPDSVFVVRDPAVPDATRDSIGLRKVAWVRSSISDSGRAGPVSGPQWKAVEVPAFSIPVTRESGSGSSPDVMVIRPAKPLDPGLYSLYVDTGDATWNARFGVGWPGIDKQAYAAGVCVDRYGTDGNYRRCETSTTGGGSADELQIHLVKPRTLEAGSGTRLVISGVVLNPTGDPRKVPALAGELRDAEGRVLARWRFKAAAGLLKPGESTSFRSTVNETPPRTRSVNVNFVTSQPSN